MMNMINHQTSSNHNEKMQRAQEYIDALEEERRKILVFQRELPLCLELVTQAIEACKQQLSSGTTVAEYNFHGQSECSEQTSTEGPILEEFIPIKRALSSDEDEEQSHKHKRSNTIISNGNDKDDKTKNNDKTASSKKSDWLRSVQLWNQTPDPPKKEDSPKKVSAVEVKKNGSTGGAFHPFKKEKNTGANAAKSEVVKGGDKTPIPVAEASSTAETGGSNGGGNVGSKKEEKEGQSQRKSRRCWSPELHKRFLSALQQLGGAHVATPKQIRELMKVDGLTNDEVKSHLQKYRLHNRRPSPTVHNNNNPQAPQFVVVGGIWMPPPPEYTAMAASAGSEKPSGGGANSNEIYAPIPTLPPHFQDLSANVKQRENHMQLLHSDHDGCSHSGGAVHSNSPSTSSSANTATTSPNY